MNDYSGCDKDEHQSDDEDDQPFSSPPSTLRRGDDANLAVYRAALKAWSELQLQQSSSSSATENNGPALAAAQEAVNNATMQLLTLSCRHAESFLLHRLEANISINQQEGDDDEDDVDEDEDDNGHDEQASQKQKVSMIPGYVMVTSERLIFCAKEASDGATTDLDISATRIDLHALSSSSLDLEQQQGDCGNGNEISNNSSIQTLPPASTAVYVQVQALESGGDDDYNSPPPLEISIVPQGHDEAAVSQKCQEIFEAISTLVSLHPIDPNDDRDDNNNNGDENSGGLSAMMMMMMGGGGADHEYCGGDSYDNDEMIWAPSTTTPLTGGGDATEEDERQAMLGRLDNLLVVPPELQLMDDDENEAEDNNNNNIGEGPDVENVVAEIVPGQFDDADEEDDDGDNDML